MASYPIQIDPVLIEAPAAIVWGILTDFPRYPEWNQFTPRVESNLEIGGPVSLYVVLKNGKLTRQNLRLDVFEPPKCIAWSLPKMIHPWLLRAYREQQVRAVSETSCEYSTCDTFSGWIAGLVYRSQKDWVAQSFAVMAAALKERAETLVASD